LTAQRVEMLTHLHEVGSVSLVMMPGLTRRQQDASSGGEAGGHLRPGGALVTGPEHTPVLGAEGGCSLVGQCVEAEAVDVVLEPLRESAPATFERASAGGPAVQGAPATPRSRRSGDQDRVAAQSDAPAVHRVEALGPDRPRCPAILADRQSSGASREHSPVDRPYSMN